MNIDWENLGFKFMPTRSNIRFHYENGQWDEGKLYDTYDITLSVAANAFHYGQALFEGGKAFRCKDGKVRIFRPEENGKRLNSSARHLMMPEFPVDKFVEAVKTGKLRHFFLIGGCDGAHPGRNYYTELAKKTPMDSLILTLACGKYRFNDLDLGEIAGFPRIMDVGQCNDAYSAVRVALALADAFECSVNELPLTLVLSWYEQKAVCILLTLLALGVKNIYLGPTLPAFLSETVVKALVDAYGLRPITAPEQDLDAILGRG